MKKAAMRTRHGFSLIELLVVIAIISLIAAMLFPVFAQSREKARQTTCLSQMRQLGMAINLYVQDYDETFPMSRLPDKNHVLTGCYTSKNHYPESGLWGSSVNWRRAILPYVKSNPVYLCPSNRYAWRKSGYSMVTNVGGDETNSYYPKDQHLPASYAMNGNFFHEAAPPCWYGEKLARPRSLPEIDKPASLILLLESRFSFPDLGNWNLSTPTANLSDGGNATDGPIQLHLGMANWLLADGHAKALKIARTCQDKLWDDQFPTPKAVDGCRNLDQLLPEDR